jgi:hypothetical protein
VGDTNNLPLIKLQEVFTPARPTIIIQTIQRYKVFIISQNKVINMARYTTEEIEDNYERYQTREDAELGHARWVKKIFGEVPQ